MTKIETRSDYTPIRHNEFKAMNNPGSVRGNGRVVVRFGNEFGFEKAPVDKMRSVIEGLQQAKELFKELEEKYDIKTAGFHPVVAHNKEKSIGSMVVSPHVEGLKMPNIEKDDFDIPEQAKPAARNLLTKLSHYVVNKHEKKAPFLSDVSDIRQYIYTPDTDELVLVDVDPYFDSGFVSETMFLDDLSLWAENILPEAEFTQWHNCMLSELGPKIWQPA